jgi:predicted acylesterase/phospholipase RssA
MSTSPQPLPDGAPEGHDAVCFTAGPKSAIVGAGTIHAYLASRRKSPKVTAGISLGAANAAALQRVYRNLARAEASDQQTGQNTKNAARWAWFRKYLAAFVEGPQEAFWNAVPDQSDFFADMEPMSDPAVPEKLQPDEPASRRARYLKVKLGRWLSQLPVSVRLCASALVNYVRMREKYPPSERVWSGVRLTANLLWLGFLLTCRVAVSPQFFPERRFPTPRNIQSRSRVPAYVRWLRIFGWLNLFSASALLVLLVPFLALALFTKLPTTFREAWGMYGTWLGILMAIGVAVRLTQHIRAQAVQAKVVRMIWVPIVAVLGVLYSLVNLTTLAMIAAAILPAVVRRAPVESDLQFELPLAIWVLFTGPFTAALALREVRSWLIEKGLFVEWPQAFSRPLFGWVPFIAAWANLTMVLASLGLAVVLVVQGWETREASHFGHLLATVALVIAVPVVPLSPFLLTFVWTLPGWLTRGGGPHKLIAGVLQFLMVLALFMAALPLFYWLLVFFRVELLHIADPTNVWWRLYVMASLGLMLTWFAFAAVVTQPLPRRWFVERTLDHLGIRHGLIPDLYLRIVLARLFGPEDARASAEEEPLVSGGRGFPAAVLVAAPLQVPSHKKKDERRPADQLYAKPGTPVLHALRCALSVPPLLSPVRLEQDERDYWLRDESLEKERDDEEEDRQRGRGRRPAPPIDLVDGSVIRQNPLPALFTFLRQTPVTAADMETMNDEGRPAIHVVYGVPVEGRPGGADGSQDLPNTIVDVGLASLRLSQRRDTQLEVLQSNDIARLQAVIAGTSGASQTRALFVDEIAPEQDVVFSNHVSPNHGELLDGVAAGCRRSMQTLYAHRLRIHRGAPDDAGAIACEQFVRSLDRGAPATGRPGLPEVCGRCTGRLKPPERTGPLGSTATVVKFLAPPVDHYEDHKQLSGKDPRIVFVASGGVFRGAFHIGLLASLKSLNVKPDLIVGASVGTLMGGALGAMWCRPDVDMLAKLVELFLKVDEKVALTRTLKNAARELGIRGRSFRLSPRRIRHLVRRGARGDPGYAATGAPSALIDAMSDLLLIPHADTREIAAEFVAGHGTSAVTRLIGRLRTETIRRLGIETAVLGSSLLEGQAIELLTDGTTAGRLNRQPFQQKDIAFYCTTTDLRTQSSLVLGGTGLHPGESYDFVEAALSSSAFPAVFGPRAESLVFPGAGHADVLFADGGMFDNLPFLPAIEILAHAQLGYRLTEGRETAGASLARRLAHPDLLIAGALDPRAEEELDERAPINSIGQIHQRAASLKHNVKIREVEFATRRVYSQLLTLQANPPAWLQETGPTILDDVVNAGVMAVFPASRDHLNGTFAFCASTGLKRRRVQKSIADGCYQTLRTVAEHQARAQTAHAELGTSHKLLTTRAVDSLTKDGRIARVVATWDPARGPRFCPFFKMDGSRFECPFALDEYNKTPRTALVRGVHHECVGDPARQRA